MVFAMTGKENGMESSTKIRILYLMDILNKFSDEDHPLSTSQIIQKLEELYGVTVHRTTVPKDISILQSYGLDVITIASTQTKYFIGMRRFEDPELKLLIDAVEASKFITAEKSEALISKLKELTSQHKAASLKRNMYVTDRIKPENEKIYYIVDAINESINCSRKISFQYYEYTGLKKKVLRNNGEVYTISPYHLVWNGDFYYVVGFSNKHNKVVSFRVDRIADVPKILNVVADLPPNNFNIAKYTKEVFRMYDGDNFIVDLKCDNSLMKVIIDRFGEDVTVLAHDMTSFRLKIEVSASPTFYGWVFGFGGKIQILGPQKIKDEYLAMIFSAQNNLGE